MGILRLMVFIGIFFGITYGIEIVLPPFGKLFYTNPLDIIGSVAQGISYGMNIAPKYAFGLTVFLIGFPPLIISIQIGKKLKKSGKYRF